MKNAFAEKLTSQFLCGKKKMSHAKVCSRARPDTENLPPTQRLAAASSVFSQLSIVISVVSANEFSTWHLLSLCMSKYLCHRKLATENVLNKFIQNWNVRENLSNKLGVAWAVWDLERTCLVP